jgi:hypothetical protein
MWSIAQAVRSPPSPGLLINTAAGDQGSPTREIGNGWWWIQ